MPLRTKVFARGGSLSTTLPAEVTCRLGLAAGMELLWADDGRGGCRVVAGSEKTRRIVDAHEAAIADYLHVFHELAK
jgi:hypothetical protein